MINLDPIRPYLSLIKTILIVGVVVGAFVTGCSYKAKDVATDMAALETQVEALSTANTKWAEGAAAATKQAQANKKLAAEETARAEKLANVISDLRSKTDVKINTLENQLQEAKRVPECSRLLQQQFCSAVPVYLPDAPKNR